MALTMDNQRSKPIFKMKMIFQSQTDNFSGRWLILEIFLMMSKISDDRPIRISDYLSLTESIKTMHHSVKKWSYIQVSSLFICSWKKMFTWLKILHTTTTTTTATIHIKGILPKGPYLPRVSMAGRALLAGYRRYDKINAKLQIKMLHCWIQFLFVIF